MSFIWWAKGFLKNKERMTCSSSQRYSVKKLFFITVFCNTHKKTRALKSLSNKNGGLQACNFIKKEISTPLFSCEYCTIFENSYFEEYHRTTDTRSE